MKSSSLSFSQRQFTNIRDFSLAYSMQVVFGVHSWLYVLRIVYLEHTVNRPAYSHPPPFTITTSYSWHMPCAGENTPKRERELSIKFRTWRLPSRCFTQLCTQIFGYVRKQKRKHVDSCFRVARGVAEIQNIPKENHATEKQSSVFGQTSKRRQGKSSKQLKTLLSTTQRSGKHKWKNIVADLNITSSVVVVAVIFAQWINF